MNITDEILNRYIDGELSSEEINELKNELNTHPEILKKLKALKITDSALHKLEIMPAPVNFTEAVMSKVKFKSKIRYSISPVFIGIISFFGILVLGVLGFIVQESTKVINDPQSELIVEDFRQKTTPYLEKIGEILSNDSVLFVSGMIAFTLLLGFYFMIHTHKTFKQNLERF